MSAVDFTPWLTDGTEVYDNNKRASFLAFADLPRRAKLKLSPLFADWIGRGLASETRVRTLISSEPAPPPSTPNLRLDYQRAAEALSQRVARDGPGEEHLLRRSQFLSTYRRLEPASGKPRPGVLGSL